MSSADPQLVKRRVGKTRLVDLAIIMCSALVWVPVLLTIAAAVLLTSGRPVLFRQERVGRHGNTFTMLKFRSMVVGDNPLVPDPSRITRIGGLLRRSSLDELPQLLNVLKGDMSLVGPRPMLPAQVIELSRHHAARHDVRPGLTGLAQVNGRNSLLWDDRFGHDLAWAMSPRLSTYARILAKTIRVVVAGEGVAGHDANDRFVDLSPARQAS